MNVLGHLGGQILCLEAAIRNALGLQVGMEAHSTQTNGATFGGKLAYLFQTRYTSAVLDEVLAQAIEEYGGDKHRIRVLDAIPVNKVHRGQDARVGVLFGAMQHDLGAQVGSFDV